MNDNNKSKLIKIMTNLNLMSKTNNAENFNNYVMAGYELLVTLKNDPDYLIWKNTFLISIDDSPQIIHAKNKNELEIMEEKWFIDKYVIDNQITIGGEKYALSPIQHEIFLNIENQNHWIFSLPTSSGKSHVIRLIAIKRYHVKKRTIIITPTIALLNEYKQEFFNMNVFSSTYCDNDNFIYILTQERAINFEFNKNDLLLVDESYLLGNMDSRAGILFHVIHNALFNNANVNLFMPNIKEPEMAINKNSFTNYFKPFINFQSLSTRKWKITDLKRDQWFEKNKNKLKDATAIFDTKSSIKTWMPWFISFFEEKKFKNEYILLIQFLELEFGAQFYPLKALKHGLVVNHGGMPKLFRYLSILFFKNLQVNQIVCTSTLTRGVNLKLKNIHIFSTDFYNNTKIDNFELRNTLGRSGRYSDDIDMRIGNVEFIGSGSVYEKFNENQTKFTATAVERETNLSTINKNEYVVKYKFDKNKNIDWIKSTFGFSQKLMTKWIENNKLQFSKYIENKYNHHQESNKEELEKIWDIFVDNSHLEDKILSIGSSILLGHNQNINPINEKVKDFIFSTLKYQGFNESLRPNISFIQSAQSELNHLIKENEFWSNGISISKKSHSKNWWKINNSLSDNQKNELLDCIIYRKVKISGKFIEAFIIPLDIHISKILGIKIEHNEIENLLEKENFPSYIKRYVLSKINKNNSLILEIKKLIQNDAHMKNIKFIIKKTK